MYILYSVFFEKLHTEPTVKLVITPGLQLTSAEGFEQLRK
jgi:hypothetical protein